MKKTLFVPVAIVLILLFSGCISNSTTIQPDQSQTNNNQVNLGNTTNNLVYVDPNPTKNNNNNNNTQNQTQERFTGKGVSFLYQKNLILQQGGVANSEDTIANIYFPQDLFPDASKSSASIQRFVWESKFGNTLDCNLFYGSNENTEDYNQILLEEVTLSGMPACKEISYRTIGLQKAKFLVVSTVKGNTFYSITYSTLLIDKTAKENSEIIKREVSEEESRILNNAWTEGSFAAGSSIIQGIIGSFEILN